MKKIIYSVFAILIVIGILFFANGYRVTIKKVPLTKKIVLVVTNSKKLYLKTYGPYTNPLAGLNK